MRSRGFASVTNPTRRNSPPAFPRCTAAHGVKPFNGTNLVGGAAQAVVGGGLYAALRRGLAEGRGLFWIRDLGRPDAVLALATGAITFAVSLIGPHLPEQSRVAVALLPAAMTLILAWRLSS